MHNHYSFKTGTIIFISVNLSYQNRERFQNGKRAMLLLLKFLARLRFVLTSDNKLPFLLKAVVLPFSVGRPRLLGRHEVTADPFFRQLPKTAMLFGNATEPVEKEKYNARIKG